MHFADWSPLTWPSNCLLAMCKKTNKNPSMLLLSKLLLFIWQGFRVRSLLAFFLCLDHPKLTLSLAETSELKPLRFICQKISLNYCNGYHNLIWDPVLFLGRKSLILFKSLRRVWRFVSNPPLAAKMTQPLALS